MERVAAAPRAENSNLRKIALAAALAGIIGAAFLLYQRFASWDPAMAATLGYPAVFLVNAVSGATLFLPVPGQATIFAAGSVLHPAGVAVAAAAGMTLGMLACYQLGVSGSPLVQKMASRQGSRAGALFAKAQGWFQRHGVLAVFLLVAVPTPFFDFAGVWAGAIRMPLWKFMAGTFLGKLASALLVALAGMYLASAVGVVV